MARIVQEQTTADSDWIFVDSLSSLKMEFGSNWVSSRIKESFVYCCGFCLEKEGESHLRAHLTSAIEWTFFGIQLFVFVASANQMESGIRKARVLIDAT